jgi:carbon-monoxide dehydrogenase medium subunit
VACLNILTPFEYFAPETLDEALELLATKENAKVIAGGTDLMIQLKEKMIHPANVIDVTHIPELNEFTVDGNGARIGACTTDAFCEFSKELQAKYPAFSYAAGEIGGPQVREMGTIGGNLANSGPSAETPASLICYRAQLVLVSKAGGERTVPVEEFITGNRKNILKEGEIIKTIILPEPDKNTHEVCLCWSQKIHGNRRCEYVHQS